MSVKIISLRRRRHVGKWALRAPTRYWRAVSATALPSRGWRKRSVSSQTPVWPMKSEPPTPARAPDNQFRKMQALLHSIRSTSFARFLGLGSGGPIPSVTVAVSRIAVVATLGRHLGGLGGLRRFVSEPVCFGAAAATILYYSSPVIYSTLQYCAILCFTTIMYYTGQFASGRPRLRWGG